MTINVHPKTLQRQIQRQIDSLNRKCWRNRRVTGALLIVGVGLPSLSAILIGTAKIWTEISDSLLTIALISNAGAAVVATYHERFNHRKLWISDTQALNQLWEIKNALDHLCARNGEPNPNDVNQLYDRFTDVMRERNKRWKVIRSEHWVDETPPNREGNKSASPNGGPATSLGNSGVTEGPPSVS